MSFPLSKLPHPAPSLRQETAPRSMQDTKQQTAPVDSGLPHRSANSSLLPHRRHARLDWRKLFSRHQSSVFSASVPTKNIFSAILPFTRTLAFPVLCCLGLRSDAPAKLTGDSYDPPILRTALVAGKSYSRSLAVSRRRNAQGGTPLESFLMHWPENTPACRNRVHLNNAGAGLMPRSVLDTGTAHLQREAVLGGYESSDEAEAAVNAAYSNVAQILASKPRTIAVVENSTVAFFQSLPAFDFRPGDVIVTTRNDYISNQLAYLSLPRRHGGEVRRAADLASGGADPQSVKELCCDSRVRWLAVQWVPTNSGLMQP